MAEGNADLNVKCGRNLKGMGEEVNNISHHILIHSNETKQLIWS